VSADINAWRRRQRELIARWHRRRRRRCYGERSREHIGGASRRGREAAAAMNHTHAALMVGGWRVVGGLASGGSADTHKINTLFTRGDYARRTHVVSAQRRRRPRRRYHVRSAQSRRRSSAAVRVNLKTQRRRRPLWTSGRMRQRECARDTHVAAAAGCGNGKNYTQTPVTGFLPFNLSVRLFTTTVRARKRRSLTIAIRCMVEVLRTFLFPAQK